MAFENIKLEKRDHIAIITIDRPKVLNALNMATMIELRDAFTELRDDVETRVVLLTGAGEKAFVAGPPSGRQKKTIPAKPRVNPNRGKAVLDLSETLGKP